MQTIFVGTDRNGEVYPYTEKPEWDEENRDFSGSWRFENCEPSFAPPPGECREYRLVPAGEADAKDARISEMEQQLSERDNQLTLARGDVEIYRRRFSDRLPGVMPQIVKQIIGELRESVANLSLSPGRLASVCEELEAYYAPPEGHEWQPVDADHPITAADVGRKVCHIDGVLSRLGPKGWYTESEVYILRPIAPPFVFAGEPGRYQTDSSVLEEVEVETTNTGRLLVCFGGKWIPLNRDGTFPGGVITGRVCK